MDKKPKKRDVAKAAAEFGAIGGRAGRGQSKRRSDEHYQRMAQIRRTRADERKAAEDKALEQRFKGK